MSVYEEVRPSSTREYTFYKDKFNELGRKDLYLIFAKILVWFFLTQVLELYLLLKCITFYRISLSTNVIYRYLGTELFCAGLQKRPLLSLVQITGTT